MTDILPKNPHRPESCVMSSVQALHECGKWEGWEEAKAAIEKFLGCSIEETKTILDRTRLAETRSPGIQRAEFTTAFGDDVLVEVKDD